MSLKAGCNLQKDSTILHDMEIDRRVFDAIENCSRIPSRVAQNTLTSFSF